jgi:hypothetical protein
MTQEEQEKLLMLLQNSQSGLEKKTVIERITGRVKLKDGDLIQIDKDCFLDENNAIREINVFNVKVFSCGCKADGRSNLGGVDYKGNVVCIKHFFRCVRCQRPLSTLTVKSIQGYCYCGRCARIVKFLKFLGIKK